MGKARVAPFATQLEQLHSREGILGAAVSSVEASFWKYFDLPPPIQRRTHEWRASTSIIGGTQMFQRREVLKTVHNRSKEFARIEDPTAAIRAGDMVIVADGENSLSSGLTLAGQFPSSS